MKKLSFALILFLSVFLFQSCQKDEVTNPDPLGQKAPELPKAESFVMEFSDFEEFAGENAPRTVDNWSYAAGNVVVWNTILTVHLAIPVAAFYESFNHDAVYQGAGVWLWAFSFSGGGQTYHAKLSGELLATNEVKWDMYISQQGGFSNVHWYSGVTENDGAYANWTLNYNPSSPTPIINIDYQKDNGNGFESIRYSNVIPGVPENGSYIEYRKTDGSGVDFNRAYDVYKIEIDNLLEIQWNKPGNDGRVKDAEHFQDSEWHCWGGDLQDVDC